MTPQPKKQNFRARVNHEKSLEQSIMRPVKGPDGCLIALREGINNSIDAGAQHVRIMYGNYEGVPALYVFDDGKGFNKKGVNSAMGYFDSSRDRKDTKTSGANGTGLKGFLGLGDIRKTKITILSVNRELADCTKMEITFEYIVNLASRKDRASNHVKTVSIPKDWLDNMSRTTGSTVIITGFKGNRVKTPQQLIEELGLELSPRSAKYVEVWDGSNWKSIVPPTFEGDHYPFVFKTNTLGTVEFDLYYSGSDGPRVCGPVNSILPLSLIVSELGRKKNKVSKMWPNLSGHIYVENGNIYREHDNSFSLDFYQSSACDEFISLLAKVSSQLEDLHEKTEDQKQFAAKQDLMEKIIDAAKIFSLLEPKSDGQPFPFGRNNVDREVYLVPKYLKIFTGTELQVQLINNGKKQVSLNDAVWVSDNPELFTITGEGTGSVVGVKAGSTLGSGKITITGFDFGTHEIYVTVAPAVCYISGSKIIQPGKSSDYEAMLLPHQNVSWSFSKQIPGVTIVMDVTDKKRIPIAHRSVKVLDTVAEGTKITLQLCDLSQGGKVIAKKVIEVTRNAVNKSSEPILAIGAREYKLVIATTYKDSIAQVDYFGTEGDDYPTIMFNPTHPRIKNVSNFFAIDDILSSVGYAAMLDQVSRGEMDPGKAHAVVEDFIAIISGKVFPDKFKDKTKKPENTEPEIKAETTTSSKRSAKKAKKTKKRGPYKKRQTA